jgi:hypothetical protein
MSGEAPQSSLPQRTWIAKFTPETLDAYLSNHDPSSDLRRSNTVWSDDFDNIIGPLPTPNDDQKSWSRRKVCQSKHPNDSSSLMAQGPQSSHLLFTDDCFLDGLVDGFGIMVIGVVLLGAIAALLWLLGMRLWSCRSTRGHRRSSSTLALLGTETESLGMESEDKLYAEKV